MDRDAMMLTLYLIAIAMGAIMAVDGHMVGFVQVVIVAVFFGLRVNQMIKSK